MEVDHVVDREAVARLLVVVAQAARGEELRRSLLSITRGRRLELCMLAPAYTGSRLEYFVSDVDPGIGRALERLERSLAEMRFEQVVACRGEVGEADPLLAIDTALVSFPADEIVLVPSAGRCQWAEKELFARVCERFGLPVWEIELTEDASGLHAVEVAHQGAVV
jgi:hypothetical protein